MQVLGYLAQGGAVSAVAWASVQIVRAVLDYRLARLALQRTSEDQMANTLRALNGAQRIRKR